ncbi:hypothetical protein JHL18_13135 [Clostridium sp. YIM B02505]|uniref:Uncharacterized protein n=1 Tax=Clostridium yunnanense TaxID=2800325 RepID=A0ABS1EQ85_9CLOT|nr:hypothetical protein [Clostridium yunnanense]MBK1811566.1 hypothetical protein [Clostridium yunnanense]
MGDERLIIEKLNNLGIQLLILNGDILKEKETDDMSTRENISTGETNIDTSQLTYKEVELWPENLKPIMRKMELNTTE